ncbi:hypothetical protein [Euzebya tangerina]|uniref:hypothetical protein n=1 Tax=Euzebya tangerina TaxID=591198 RepID=UPI000E3197CE|nr:hypothetical protein [Euzebya tangerina]
MGKRNKKSDKAAESVANATATATDHVVAAASQVEKKAGNAVVRLLVGVITLLLNLVRGLLATILGGLGGIISAIGSTLNGVSNVLKAPLVGAAKAISPLDHAPAAVEDATGKAPKSGKKASSSKKDTAD